MTNGYLHNYTKVQSIGTDAMFIKSIHLGLKQNLNKKQSYRKNFDTAVTSFHSLIG